MLRIGRALKGCSTQVLSPPPFKAEPRKLPTGEMYAVREVGQHRPSKVPLSFEKKWNLNMTRKPSSEEMVAIRENGDRRDDPTKRDGPSIEIVDIVSDMSATAEPKKSTKFLSLPSEFQSPTEGATTSRGLVKLEDDGVSSKDVGTDIALYLRLYVFLDHWAKIRCARHFFSSPIVGSSHVPREARCLPSGERTQTPPCPADLEVICRVVTVDIFLL
uniref:Uncharacterized protein n=1 Tax=Angiostrongylus cantonensis TaxID=6313 RepID=A0A158P8T7_ANGCA